AFMHTPFSDGIDGLTGDVTLDVSSKLSAVLGGGGHWILLVFGVDVGLTHRRVHAAGLALPDQDRTVVTEVPVIILPKRPAAGVRAARAQHHGPRDRRHRGLDGRDDLVVRVGANLVGRPKRAYWQECTVRPAST